MDHGQRTSRFMMAPRNDLDLELPAHPAQMTDVVVGAKPELVNPGAQGRVDHDLVAVVLEAVRHADDLTCRGDDLNVGVEMVGTHQFWMLEWCLDMLSVSLNSLVLGDLGEDRRWHGSSDGQCGLEHERVVVGPEEGGLRARGVNL